MISSIPGLDIWDTDFIVVVSYELVDKIRQKIIVKASPIKLYKSTLITPTIYYRFIHRKRISIKNYEQIINFLDINKKEAENGIIGVTYTGENKVYPYIKKLDPLLFRVICHMIGDGSLASGNTYRWVQHKLNSHWLKELIENEVSISPSVSKHASKNCHFVTIPAYFARLTKYILKVDINLIKKPLSIKKFLNLPKEHRLQFLAALIVDEGHVRYKNARSCIISQSEYGFLKVVSDILDSLGYQHSEIKKETSRKGFVTYRLNIYSQGMLQFYKDIDRLIQKYGVYAGLWHKQTSFDEYIRTLNKDIKHTKPEKDLMNKLINEIIKDKTFISYKELKNHPIIKEKLKTRNKRYLINKFYEMVKQGKLIRISKGKFQLPNL